MNEEQRALLIVGALLSSMSGTGGFVGGRVSAPVPPAEVRVVRVQARPVLIAPSPRSVPEAPPTAVVEPAIPPAPAEPQPPVAEAKPPLPAPRPKVETNLETKPRPHPRPAAPRPARKPTASECAQLKLGMLTIGKDGVITKAKARGYSSSQVVWAISACGL